MCESSAAREALPESCPRRRGTCPRIAIAPAIDMVPHTHSAPATDRLSIRAPTAAPANIAITDATRLCHLGLVPPARDESAARPVIVSVNTVVVRSGTPTL